MWPKSFRIFLDDLEINSQFIFDAADFILQKNSLTFDSMFSLQLEGTAMSTVFAPTYTNLTMAYHKIQVFSSLKIL